MRSYNPCTFDKACHILWAVRIKGWTQTRAAISAEISQGTACHIVHRRRYPSAYPRPLPGYH